MTLSLGEASAMAKKATRGAGYTWGLAEDASAAVRWLAERDLNGCGALAAALTAFDGVAWSAIAPTISGTRWGATSGRLCPLAAGTALADRAEILPKHDLLLHEVVAPILLLPFASDAAQVTGRTLGVTWAGGAFVTDGEELSGELTADITADVSLRFDVPMDAHRSRVHRASPGDQDWRTLMAFAERTYAPATDASRMSGAGAGTTDND